MTTSACPFVYRVTTATFLEQGTSHQRAHPVRLALVFVNLVHFDSRSTLTAQISHSAFLLLLPIPVKLVNKSVSDIAFFGYGCREIEGGMRSSQRASGINEVSSSTLGL